MCVRLMWLDAVFIHCASQDIAWVYGNYLLHPRHSQPTQHDLHITVLISQQSQYSSDLENSKAWAGSTKAETELIELDVLWNPSTSISISAVSSIIL